MDGESIRTIRDRLQLIQRRLAWSQKNDVQCCGVTMAQCYALMEIGKRGKASIVELADSVGVDTSTLSRTIDLLYKSGLVDRVLNPQDRRYVALSLTQRGSDVFRMIDDSFNSYLARVFGLIEKEKHPQVIESLEVIASAIERCNDEFPCCTVSGPEKEGGR